MEIFEILSGATIIVGTLVAIIAVINYLRHADPLYWRGSEKKIDLLYTIIAMIPVILVYIGIQAIMFMNSGQVVLAVSAPLFEEPTKLTVIYLLFTATAFSKRLFRKRWLYYGILSGLSFGIIEYITYSAAGFQFGVLEGMVTMFVRIPPMLLHVALGSLDALALYYWIEKKRIKSILAFSLAIVIHATTNYLNFLLSNTSQSILLAATFMGIVLLIYGLILLKKKPYKISYADFMVPVLRYAPKNRLFRALFRFLIMFYVPINKYRRVCAL